MLINKITKQFHIRFDKPNENWLNDDNYFFIKDDSELAKKIKKLFPFLKFVLNENGELLDVEDDNLNRTIHIKTQKYFGEIEGLKKNLFDTDYQALKYAEGHLSEEEYAPIKEQRQAWRDRINELEASLEVQNETIS